MLHIKKLKGMHNKGTYTRVLTYAYTRIDIRVYAKYKCIIRIYVVQIYLSCTVLHETDLLECGLRLFEPRVTFSLCPLQHSYRASIFLQRGPCYSLRQNPGEDTECVKEVISGSWVHLHEVDFAIWLVNSACHLSSGQVKFLEKIFEEIQITDCSAKQF